MPPAQPKKKPTKRKAPKKPARPSREPSQTPKAVYMREYRRRKAAGEQDKTYRKVTPEMLQHIVELREQGMSLRGIGAEMEMDHSYVARLLKRAKSPRTG